MLKAAVDKSRKTVLGNSWYHGLWSRGGK